MKPSLSWVPSLLLAYVADTSISPIMVISMWVGDSALSATNCPASPSTETLNYKRKGELRNCNTEAQKHEHSASGEKLSPPIPT